MITAKSIDMTLKMDGTGILSFAIDKSSMNEAKRLINDFKALDKFCVSVDKVKKKRSLDANSFMWVLCQRIAEKVGNTKENVYRKFIKDVGVFEIVPIAEKAVDRWLESWNSKGIGWVSEILSDSKLEGYKNTINYYGSSTYDTAEMSRLINEVVNTCKELEIPTETPTEIALLLERWGE